MVRAAGQHDEVVDVAIVGGGITGLSSALRVIDQRPGTQVRVLEASTETGGVLQTTERDGYLIEGSADSFITVPPYALDFCRRLGIEDRLIPTNATHRRAFVVSRGRLEPIPEGLHIMAPSAIWPLLTTRILSWPGKVRMAAEAFISKGSGADESLANFARRRLGSEAYERLIQPLVGGMYTGDPEQLSVKATLPRFLDMEQRYGSLIRAVRWGGRQGRGGPAKREAAGSGARYGLFTGLEQGVGQLVEAVVSQLPPGTIEKNSEVTRLTRTVEGRWQLEVGGSRPRAIQARRVVIATPARIASQLLRSVQDHAASLLAGIASTSCAVVSLAYDRAQVGHPLDGFGFVVPFAEELPILSGSFSSIKFSGRAPAGGLLVRVFMGGARRPELLERDDAELVTIASQALDPLLTVNGPPRFGSVSRWRQTMPQYYLGHLERVAEIRQAVQGLGGTLAVAGNYLTGVGVPHCIHNGQLAADAVLPGLEPSLFTHRPAVAP